MPDSRGSNLYAADPTLGTAWPRCTCRPNCSTTSNRTSTTWARWPGGSWTSWAGTADRNPPVLRPRTRTGADRARIDKHPAYLTMERLAFGEYGFAALSHRGGVLGWPDPMPPAAKYLLTFLFAQAEFGLLCPVSMTDSLTRTLRRFGSPDLVERHLPALLSGDLDALCQGAMFMTEQGAGSDVGGHGGRGARRTRTAPGG